MQYAKPRDMKCIYANVPTRWSKFSAPLMSKLASTKSRSSRQVGRRTKHLYDWMAPTVYLAKGSSPSMRIAQSQCPLCAKPETQQHINATCTHPQLVEIRCIHQSSMNEFLQCYKYQHLHVRAQWIIPLIDYMEDHMWTDSETGGDIWNGR
jgi:hypothetical protein